MKRFHFSRWYNDLSLSKRLYFTMAVIGISITIGLLLQLASLHSLSAFRSFTNSNTLWVKAQTDAVYNLSRYALEKKETDYRDFLQNMQVPIGDRIGRLELEKTNPDYNIARRGFKAGLNHPDDIPGMIQLFRRYRQMASIKKAIAIRENQDYEIIKLMLLGKTLHREITSTFPSQEKIFFILSQIYAVNKNLSVIENDFSKTLTGGGRWMENLILKILLFILFIIVGTAALFIFKLNRNSIKEIKPVAKKVATENIGSRALISSKDESDVMNLPINGMITSLKKQFSETNQAYKKLVIKNKQLDHAQQSASIGSWEWDVRANSIEWSDELFRILGYKPGEFKPTYNDYLAHVHPEDKFDLDHSMRNAFEAHKTGNIELYHRVYRKDATERILTGKVKLYAENDVIIKMTGIIRDITDARKSEMDFINKTRQLAEAQASAHIGNWEWNFVSGELEWSDELYRIHGLIPGEPEITYERWVKFIHPDDEAYFENILKQQYPDQHQTDVSYRIIRPDGTMRMVHGKFKVFTDSTDKTIRMRGTIQDVTELKKAEEALLYKTEQLNKAQQSARIGSWEWNAQNNSLEWSAEMFRIYGVTNSEFNVSYEAAIKLVHPDDAAYVQKVFMQQENYNKRYNIYFRIIRPDGVEVTVNARAQIFSDIEGNIRRITGTVQDVTLQKENEQELVRLKELAEASEKIKDQFLANMSHEIRTPMNAIIGFSDLLTESNLGEDEKDYVKTIKHAGENLLTIINDILDISKIEAGMMVIQKSNFSIKDSLKSLNELMALKAQQKNIQLSFTCAPNVPETVTGDGIRFSQIMINLIGNAVKFTENGKIDVSAEIIEYEKHDLNNDEVKVQFCVRDTGIGIPADKLENIFERFRQTEDTTTRNSGGTGLGLSIAKQLVELQGGEIRVESIYTTDATDSETGSVFTFTIPYSKTAAPVIKKTEKNKYDIAQLQQIRILVAEDNPINVKLLQHLFKKFNLRCEVAENGRICINMTEKTTFDIILMDMEMPVLTGYEATEIIRNEMKNKIPIIAMTANAMAGEREKCLALGMNDYISKPVNAELLFEKIYDLTFNV